MNNPHLRYETPAGHKPRPPDTKNHRFEEDGEFFVAHRGADREPGECRRYLAFKNRQTGAVGVSRAFRRMEAWRRSFIVPVFTIQPVPAAA